MHTLILVLVILAFVLIVLEDVIHLNKAKSTLFLGTLVWILAFIHPDHGVDQLRHGLDENLLEIATLWLFLVAAMTFVAYLNQKGLITQVVYRALPAQLPLGRLMLLTALLGFLFSSFADNITASLIMLSLLASLDLEKKDMLKFAAIIVFSVNSGGVSLITGDVTTLMIFLADKVTVTDLFVLIAPAITALLFLALLLMRGATGEVTLPRFKRPIDPGDKVIAGLFLGTIFATLGLSIAFRIPPVLTFLFGLSVMFLVHRVLFRSEKKPDAMEYIRDIEFDTLLFFLGVLLLVGMLKELAVLDYLLLLYDTLPIEVANYLLGISSALVDNVPLTAAVLKAGVEMDKVQWLGLTYAVGVGGSLLVIGSAAGVIALGKLQELTFMTYLRFFHWLMLAYTAGYIFVLALASAIY